MINSFSKTDDFIKPIITHKGTYMDDNGTYLGNICGIYKECITNISIDIYDTVSYTHLRAHET